MIFHIKSRNNLEINKQKWTCKIERVCKGTRTKRRLAIYHSQFFSSLDNTKRKPRQELRSRSAWNWPLSAIKIEIKPLSVKSAFLVQKKAQTCPMALQMTIAEGGWYTQPDAALPWAVVQRIILHKWPL